MAESRLNVDAIELARATHQVWGEAIARGEAPTVVTPDTPPVVIDGQEYPAMDVLTWHGAARLHENTKR